MRTPPTVLAATCRFLGAAALALGAALPRPGTAADPAPQPPTLAVFDFELDDVSAGASPAGPAAADLATLKAVSERARQTLAQSGRYRLIDTSGADDAPLRAHALRSCNGCEAAIAARLGAAQSLLGIITRVEKTQYAVSIRIRDAASGSLVDQQSALLLGSDDGWASGAASVLRHRVLDRDYPTQMQPETAPKPGG